MYVCNRPHNTVCVTALLRPVHFAVSHYPKGAFTLRIRRRATSYDNVPLRGRPTSYMTTTYVLCMQINASNNKLASCRLRMTFTMSFWLLVVIFTRLANFLVVEIDKLDLDASGFTTCCVVEMTWVNMPDSYKNCGWTVTVSTDTFRCQQSSLTVLRLFYQLCRPTWLCMCRDVRRRTWSYDVVRSCALRTPLLTLTLTPNHSHTSRKCETAKWEVTTALTLHVRLTTFTRHGQLARSADFKSSSRSPCDPVIAGRDPVKNQSQKLKPFNFYVQVKITFNPVITFFGVINPILILTS